MGPADRSGRRQMAAPPQGFNSSCQVTQLSATGMQTALSPANPRT